MQRGTAQGGFGNRPAAVAAPATTNATDTPADQESAGVEQDPNDPGAAPAGNPDGDPADQGSSGS